MKKFEPLNVSSKWGICGLPLRVDSYKTCSFGCRYCFANGREIMETSDGIAVADTDSVERRLRRIFNDGFVKEDSFLDTLIANRITWHFGGMSDPFQPCNEELKATNRIIEIANRHGMTILFSTKSDTVHGADIRPDLHSFQMSVSNVHDRRDIEPNVPSVESRLSFFNTLKKAGFKVGIRIQPFIPGISTLEILETFRHADHFTIEGIKAIPQEGAQKDWIFNVLGQNPKHYTQMGLMNIKPEKRMEMYRPFIEYFEKNGMSYSVSDNDMRYLGNSRCCCGDALAPTPTGFDTTAMCMAKGIHYRLCDVKEKASPYLHCRADSLVASNRVNGCRTVEDFLQKRFREKTSPTSPLFQYIHQPALFDL